MAVGLINEIGTMPEVRDGKIETNFRGADNGSPPSGAENCASRAAPRRSDPCCNFQCEFSWRIRSRRKRVAVGCLDTYKGSSNASGRHRGVLRGGSWATSNRLEMQSSYWDIVDRNDRDVIY